MKKEKISKEEKKKLKEENKKRKKANKKKIDKMKLATQIIAALMAICSWISIPLTVPFTLQTFAVFVTLGILGGKRGTLSILVFLLLGAIGVPVFAGFTGGMGILLGNTGGYIIGFILSALVMWIMETNELQNDYDGGKIFASTLNVKASGANGQGITGVISATGTE